MRRVFIIRKDLNLKPGKLAAMVGHCAEAYWTNLLKASNERNKIYFDSSEPVKIMVTIPRNIWNDYVNSIFTKTICEAKNKASLQKAIDIANDLGLKEGISWGYINDRCLTDLTPENEDGTCTIGLWFMPLEDDIAHQISKKYKLYGAFDK